MNAFSYTKAGDMATAVHEVAAEAQPSSSRAART